VRNACCSVWGSGFGISGLGVSRFAFRFSRSGFRVSGFGFRSISQFGFGIAVEGVGFRILGFGF